MSEANRQLLELPLEKPRIIVRKGARKLELYSDQKLLRTSLGLSYPNADDAERGLREEMITQSQHDAILEAIRKKTGPPQYTKLGGLIYIHGHGAASDWTWGCVALENDDIKEVYEAVSVGTPVTIVP